MAKWVTVKLPLSQLRIVLACANTDLDRTKKIFANATAPSWMQSAEKGISRLTRSYVRGYKKYNK